MRIEVLNKPLHENLTFTALSLGEPFIHALAKLLQFWSAIRPFVPAAGALRGQLHLRSCSGQT